MSIRRTAFSFESKFTTIPNAWVRDKRLSRKARGLLVELMSHAPGWEITIESLVDGAPEGRDSVRTAISELEQYGYLKREQNRQERGRWGNVDYVLAEPTVVGFSDVGESDTKKTISQEDHQEDLTKTSQRQSSLIAASDRTDSNDLSRVTARLAAQWGLTPHRLDAIAHVVREETGRSLSKTETFQVARWILEKSRGQVKVSYAYVIRAVSTTPIEVQKYIDDHGLGSS
jgi:hypothetical protein